MEFALVSLLHAVPKAWRVTIALTQPRAVEPLRGLRRGVVGSALVGNRIFKYYYLPNRKQVISLSVIFYTSKRPFLTFAKVLIFQFLASFL
jgi:hypothetical protein